MLTFLFIILVHTTECKSSIEAYVIGGRYSTIENFPHAVFLSIKSSTHSICGGSVVNQKIILTAAHCIYACTGRRSSVNCQVNAYAGSTSLETMKVLRVVVGITCHEHYDDFYAENDLALATINESLPLGQGLPIKRVMLMSTFPENLKDIEVSGWGIIDERTRESSVKLKSVKQRMLPRVVCESAAFMHPGMMCSGSIIDDEAPTSGDSGSAVVTPNHQQIGLVSYRSSLEDLPEDNQQGNHSRIVLGLRSHIKFLYYTNVSYYYSWIKRHAAMLYCMHD